MRYFILLMFTGMLSISISGQSISNHCGYEADLSFKDYAEYKDIVEEALSNSVKNSKLGLTSIPIAVTFLMKSDSTSSYDEGYEDSMIDSISSQLLSSGLHFYLAEAPVFIYEDLVYDFVVGENNELIYPGIKNKALNVIICNSVSSNGTDYCGIAKVFPGTVFIKYKCIPSTTLSHEIGHELGLLHTFDQKWGKELVDGSNCDFAGDLICDTPADPNRLDLVSNDNNNCLWIGIYEDEFGNEVDLVDSNGDKYNPDLSNIMSYYALFGCTNDFTYMQSLVMNESLLYQNYGYETLKMKFDIYKRKDLCDDGYIVSCLVKNVEPNVEYQWDFDSDGVIDMSGVDAEHLYTDYGNYTIKLIMTYPDGRQFYQSKVCIVEYSNESIVAPFLDDFEDDIERNYVTLISQGQAKWRLGGLFATDQIFTNENSIMEYRVNISGMEQAHLEFDYDCNANAPSGGDSLLIELLTCGSEPIALFEKWGIDLGTDGEFVTVSLPLPVVDTDEIRLRFTSKGNEGFSPHDIFIDNIKVDECNTSVDTLYFNECDSVIFDGTVYETSGTFEKNYTNIIGCDSTLHLNVTIQESISTTQSISICEGEFFEGYSQEGVYTDYFDSKNGCDSIRTLNLIILPIDSSEFSTSICEGESFEGYAQEGIYIDYFVSQNGCDSIRTLNLITLPIDSSEFSTSICEGESFEGYSQVGLYIDYYVSQNGCDSIRTLKLDIFPISESTIIDTICEGETIEAYSISGIYTDTFISELGCDSIRTLLLEVLPSEHEDCIPSSNDDLTRGEDFIYPNPINDFLYVNKKVTELSIYSTHGKLIQKERLFHTNNLNLSHLQSGIYIISLSFSKTMPTRTIIVYKI